MRRIRYSRGGLWKYRDEDVECIEDRRHNCRTRGDEGDREFGRDEVDRTQPSAQGLRVIAEGSIYASFFTKAFPRCTASAKWQKASTWAFI